MIKLSCLKTVLITSPLLLTTAFADEQPKAEDLVGKFYGGAHLLYLKTDSDRDMPEDPLSTVNHGSGFGGEIGYRYSELAELRFSYSKINIDKKASFFDKVYVPAIDFLYFPTKQNFYWLGGASYLDIVEHHSPLLRDAIISIIGKQPEAKVKSIKGRSEIQLLCEEQVKELLTKETGQPLIKKLLFTQWLDN
jgi:hypothetical protein